MSPVQGYWTEREGLPRLSGKSQLPDTNALSCIPGYAESDAPSLRDASSLRSRGP